MALAATAGIAIENARLFDETREREAWMAASADLTARVLSLDEVDRLGGLADRIREVAAADLVSLVLPENPDDAAAGPIDGLVVAVARGLGAEASRGPDSTPTASPRPSSSRVSRHSSTPSPMRGSPPTNRSGRGGTSAR